MPLNREVDPEQFRRDAEGVFGLGNTTHDETPWFKRWYVWVLPGLVLIGVIVALVSR